MLARAMYELCGPVQAWSGRDVANRWKKPLASGPLKLVGPLLLVHCGPLAVLLYSNPPWTKVQRSELTRCGCCDSALAYLGHTAQREQAPLEFVQQILHAAVDTEKAAAHLELEQRQEPLESV